MADAWKIAPVLVGAGVDEGALASLASRTFLRALSAMRVRWIALRLTIRALLDDAEQSTGRIADLV